MSLKYTLLCPINFGSREVTELNVEKPTAKVLKKFKNTNMAEFSEQIKLVAACTGEVEPLVEILDLDDFMGVVNIIMAWFLKAADNRPSI